MANKINELKLAVGAGARKNKYRINFAVPAAVPAPAGLDSRTLDILAKATKLPDKTIKVISLYNQGRKLNIPGDTDYQGDTGIDVTFYLPEDYAPRQLFLNWLKACDNFQQNVHTGNPAALMVDMSIEQLDSVEKSTVKTTLHNAFPYKVAGIELSDEAAEGVSEVTVSIAFSDFVTGDGENDEPLTYNQATKNDTAL